MVPMFANAFDVNVKVNTTQNRKVISPYIYGSNQTLTGDENFTAARYGGNRWTGYNWENNASNAGEDYINHSDAYLGGGTTPCGAITNRRDSDIQKGIASIFTVPMAGYVARDKDGTVEESETAPSDRWDELIYEKGTAFTETPDLTDGKVYADEMVNFLVNKYGSASETNDLLGYELDNEPALWPSTHPRIHKNQPTCVELTEKSGNLAKAIRAVDENSKIFGPVFYGFGGMITFQNATDWNSVSSGKGYNWFVDYYLDRMKGFSDDAGKRLLNVLDIHWYSEAKGDNRITSSTATTQKDREARVQAPRTLWDSTYIENSWIGQYGQNQLPLLPEMQKSINKWYPETKMAVTEWNYGGVNDISGGIAAADVLGIFGKYSVYLASYWNMGGTSDYSYMSAAYKIYRNFDGKDGTFGTVSVEASTDDAENSSVYSSVDTSADNNLHLILINKSFSESMNAKIAIEGGDSYDMSGAWSFNSTSSDIAPMPIANDAIVDSFNYTVPSLTVCHLILTPKNVATKNLILQKNRLNIKLSQTVQGAIKCDFTMREKEKFRIEIYDTKGKFIQTLYSGVANLGKNSFTSKRVSRGVYLASIKTDHGNFCKKIALK